MKFITSISPRSIGRAKDCIATWMQFHPSIVSVNPIDEIVQLQDYFPNVEFVQTDDLDQTFETECPKLRALVSQCPGIIINSDIEIHTDVDLFMRKIVYPDEGVLKCGVRFDYAGDRNLGRLNRYGIDVFNITATLKNILSATEFTIGQPGWDYYVAIEANLHGLRVMPQIHHMFFHKEHPVNWSRWRLTLAQAMLEKRYDKSQSEITRLVQRITGRRR